jgi:hypothetical protein
MDVRVVYFDGCPNWRTAQQRLAEAMTFAGLPETPVSLIAVTSSAQAVAAGFAGSPTILINGHDLFPGPAVSEDLACRLYMTSQGPAGCPTVEDLVSALQREESP